MIKSLSIAKTATYGDAVQTLDGLARFNFLFGSNGAGKTTITRIITDPTSHPNCTLSWEKGAALEALVYNRDFVERNFNTAPRLKGIFTLGEHDIVNLEAIAEKKAELDEIAAKIENRTNTLHGADQKAGKKKELADLDIEIKDKCWAQKIKHEEIFSEAFKGLRNNSEKFKEHTLSQFVSNTAELKTVEYLTEKAKTVFGPTPLVEPTVPLLGAGGVLGHEANTILVKKVIGKEDVDIAALIQRLGNSDWVKQGQAFYEQSMPDCPFCQQKAPEGFEKSLVNYFDETFEQDTKAIADLQSAYDRDSKALLLRLQTVVDAQSRFLDRDSFIAEQSAIEAKLTANALLMTNKRKEPSLPIVLDPLEGTLATASNLISAANDAVDAHNEIARNIAKERADLTAQVWKYILEVELKLDIATYTSKRAGLDAAIAKISAQIQEFDQAKKALADDIKTLEKAATTVQPTIDGINALLKSFGFRTFQLAKVDDGPFYKLVRADGKDAKESLSEGERSFVTFLYFYHLLKGSENESGMTTDRVVVFDDPVSSLDSDVLFIVSSLIRSLFDDVRSDKGHIKQIFVLTHNVYFHKEVTYTSNRGDDEKKGERTYWVVRKSDAGATVERHKSNPIKTSYDLLWEELRREDKSPLTIQNTMRRILENYFKILGRIDFEKICDEFEGSDKVTCRSLFAWVNDGSHFAHDDAFFTLDDGVIGVYLEIFKQIFIKSNQQAHYEMMMAVPQ
ncbi:AAA family ATPase [Pseudomonas fluorescens]|uniref:AAA family ATPase n=1 Tax=Pseudomonas fluorescens TaxID=294 RepID=UPI003D1B476C